MTQSKGDLSHSTKKIDMAALKPFGPPANRSRAKAIAHMDEFGLDEFIELTGIGSGRYGIYRIDDSGISIMDAGDACDLSPDREHAIRQASKKLSLRFPCSPKQFIDWYDFTKGLPSKSKSGQEQPGVSDFPLARGFLPEIDYLSTSPDRPVSTEQIIAAFTVGSPEESNRWWKERMGSANRNGLTECRATGGRGRKSTWHPTAVATWMIGKKGFRQATVVAVMKEHFADYDISFLEI